MKLCQAEGTAYSGNHCLYSVNAKLEHSMVIIVVVIVNTMIMIVTEIMVVMVE